MSAFSEYRRMDKIAETWRGTRASLVWLSEAPIVNARIALSTMNKEQARMLMASQCAKFLATCRVNVEMHGEPPSPGKGCVLNYNETSFADVMAYGSSLWGHIDRAAAAELYGYLPFGRSAARKAGIELVPRGNRQATERLLHKIVAALKRGERLAWGGEGRLQGQDAVGRFKVGGSLIAIRAQVPIIPLVFCGGHQVMPLGSMRARAGKILIRFGAPIPTTGLKEDEARSLADQVQEIAVEIYAELKEAWALST